MRRIRHNRVQKDRGSTHEREQEIHVVHFNLVFVINSYTENRNSK